MLISEKECIRGFSFARLSQSWGFKSSESRLIRNVRLPSDESLLQIRVKNTKHQGNGVINHQQQSYVLLDDNTL